MRFVITRYRITGCWFGRKPRDTEVNPAELDRILDGFHTWVNNTTHMTQTQILGSQPFNVFVKDCGKHGMDYVIGLWLSSTDRNDNVYAIQGDDPPNGDQRIDVLRHPDGSIPGMPAFFFVDAAANGLFAMRPEQIRISGKPQFDMAIRYYMANHAGTIERHRHVEDDGENVIELNMIGEDGATLTPRFESELQKNPTVSEEILRRVSEIRKIIRVQDISKKSIAERKSAVKRVFSLIGASIENEDVTDSRRIRCEVDVRLTREDVERLIQRQGDAASDEKIAFKFKGDKKKIWADNCIARKTIDLQFDADEPQGVTARKLLSAIERNRQLVVE